MSLFDVFFLKGLNTNVDFLVFLGTLGISLKSSTLLFLKSYFLETLGISFKSLKVL